MPKRRNYDEIAFLAKRLKKIEQQLKKRDSRRRSSNESISSSSSGSSYTSRSSAAPSVPEYPNYQNASMREALSRQSQIADEHGYAATTVSPPQVPLPQAPGVAVPLPQAPGVAVPLPQSTVSNVTLPQPSTPAVLSTMLPVEQVEDFTEILGTDPSESIEFGDDINKEVAHRFEYFATSGLDKTEKTVLLKSYLIPSNCKLIAPPQLNAEIKAALTDPVVKRDTAIESRQKQMAVAITNIGHIVSTQLSKPQRDNDLIKQLMDTGRIMCDLQYNQSITRRNFALYSIKKEIKDQLVNTKIDKYLFGSDLPETLKAAKAVSRSVTELKIYPTRKPGKPMSASNALKNLNWKAGPAARRQPPGLPPNQPAVAPRQHHRGSSSRKSSHRNKQTHRR